MFNGVRDPFVTERGNPIEFITSKLIGFGSVIKAYPTIHKKCVNRNELTRDFFKRIFPNFKIDSEKNEIRLTLEFFDSNEQSRTKLANLIVE